MDEYGPVPPAQPRGGKGGKPGGTCCQPGWQLTAIFCVVLIGTCTLIGLVIAIISKGDDLDRTSRATQDMHRETMDMRKNIEDALRPIRDHLPANQGIVTTEQVLDSIDKGHAVMLWVNQLRSELPPDVLEKLIKNAGSLVGNANNILGSVQAAFDAPNESERHRAILGNAALFFAKSAELLSTVSPAEFHVAFSAGNEALQAMARLSQNLDHARVNRIVESASDILGSADSAHIVSVIAELAKGASDVIHRFARPGGLRLSLPIGGDSASAGIEDAKEIKK